MPTDATREVVEDLVEHDGAQLIEVLPREDYEWAHLPGARHIPLSEIDERVRELDRSRPVVPYCNDFQ
jgi:rhodanese-related sulfurtransferase